MMKKQDMKSMLSWYGISVRVYMTEIRSMNMAARYKDTKKIPLKMARR